MLNDIDGTPSCVSQDASLPGHTLSQRSPTFNSIHYACELRVKFGRQSDEVL